jgi:3-hydroxyisobutyrate dehydrogenase-like beta-hydroxyacid dehydrogenase
MTTVGMIGLGIMGSALTSNLIEDGFDVIGFDIDDGAVEALAARGGGVARSPADLAAGCDVVLIAIATLGVLADIVGGPDGVIAGASPGTPVADLGTLPLEEKLAAREVCAAAGIPFLDCAMSGTGAQAADRDLVFMASGDHDAIERIRPVLGRLGTAVHDVGDFGNATKMKLVANLLVAVHNAAAAEALLLAEKAGIDPHRAIEVLAEGAGGSRMLGVRGPMIADRSYHEAPTARVSMFMKDLGLIEDLARRVGAPTPLLDVTHRLYEETAALGYTASDAAAVHAAIEARAGEPKEHEAQWES